MYLVVMPTLIVWEKVVETQLVLVLKKSISAG